RKKGRVEFVDSRYLAALLLPPTDVCRVIPVGEGSRVREARGLARRRAGAAKIAGAGARLLTALTRAAIRNWSWRVLAERKRLAYRIFLPRAESTSST